MGAPPSGFEFGAEFSQQYQQVQGLAHRGGQPIHLREMRLAGDRIRFVLVDAIDYTYREVYEGRISGAAMEGTVVGEGGAPHVRQPWRAVRMNP